MNVAIIKNGTVSNVAVFTNLATARAFLTMGALDGDCVVECAPGFGIGDMFDASTEVWSAGERQQPPEPEPAPETPEYTVDDYLIEFDYRISLLELNGGEIT